MEVIGGIKVENLLIKSEADEDEENIVEIGAEDIQDIEKESEAWAKPINLDYSQNNIQTSFVDIVKENITRNNQQYTKSDGVKVKAEKEEVPHSETKIVQEELIMNCTSDLPQKKKYHTKKKAIKKNPWPKTRKKKFKKSLIENDKTKMILLKEYSKKRMSDKKIQYHCNHCQAFVTNLRNIHKHIRDNHRDTIIFLYEAKKLDELAKRTATQHVAWFEYTLEDGDRYRCSHCQDIIQGQGQTVKHINEKHRAGGVKLYQCPYCSKQSRFDLKSHIIGSHTDEKDITYFRCEKCDFKSKYRSGLRRHAYTHMDPNDMLDKMFRCLHCPKMYKTPDALRMHKLYVHNPKSVKKLKCFHCPYESKSKAWLKHHMERHHSKIKDLETLQCSQCTFETKFKASLNAHVSIAHNQAKRVFQCHICSYQCTLTQLFKLHLLSHKKDKNEKDWKYHCDTCDYKAYRLYSLQIHKLNHLKPEEIQYFYCYHCDFKAKRKDNLKTHIFRQHKKDEGLRLLQCYICDFTTKKNNQFVRHIDMHSKDLKEGKAPKTGVIRPTEQSSKEVTINRRSKRKRATIM